MPRLVEGLAAGALPALTYLGIYCMHVGVAGAEALAAALGRGALPRLKTLALTRAAIGDAALVALAPALRRLPALEGLALAGNPLGDEGLAALLAPPPPAGTPPLAAGCRAEEAPVPRPQLHPGHRRRVRRPRRFARQRRAACARDAQS